MPTENGKLLELIAHLKVKTSTEGKSKFKLINVIHAHNTEALEAEGGPDGGVTPDEFVQDQIAFISNKPPPLEKDKAEEETYELQKQLDALKMKQLEELSEIESKLTKAKQKSGSTEPTSTSTSTSEESKGASKTVEAAPETKAEKVEVTSTIYKREFKVVGQIGKAGQSAKLTSVTLIHQIESGLAKNYSELEIVEAIIKSISPHSSLRNYVLTLPDRSLAKLRKVLRVFSRKKTAAELYQDLVNTCQQPKESAQQFLLRLLDFRNKVIFASQEEESQFEYSLKLVQNTFLKSLETGLRDEALVTNLRPHLRLAEVSDEELVKVVNELASKQAERKMKMAVSPSQQKNAKVNTLSAAPDKPELAKQKPKNESLVLINEKLFAEIKGIKTDLSNLKEQVRENKTPSGYRQSLRFNWPRTQPLTPRGCMPCRNQGRADSCRHCFNCGTYGHVKATCRRPHNSGN